MSSDLDHSAWLLGQVQLSIPPIRVDSPLEEGSGFSKYITYAVCLPTFSVRHRYSDFEKLQTTLKTRHSTYGLLVPSLPKKNFLKGAGFHFQRMRGLQIFCEKVQSNPYLRTDGAWTSFLKPSTQPVIERELMPAPNERWMQAVEGHETPKNCGELMAAFKSESVQCEVRFCVLQPSCLCVSSFHVW